MKKIRRKPHDCPSCKPDVLPYLWAHAQAERLIKKGIKQVKCSCGFYRWPHELKKAGPQ